MEVALAVAIGTVIAALALFAPVEPRQPDPLAATRAAGRTAARKRISLPIPPERFNP